MLLFNSSAFVVNALKSTFKIPGRFESGESKRRIQYVVFPDGLMVDTEKRQYLTDNINSVFTISGSISNDKSNKKSDSKNLFLHESLLVAGARLERTTFGL